MEFQQPSSLDLAHLKKIIIEESGKEDAKSEEKLGLIFRFNRLGLAAAITRLEIASGQQILFGDARKSFETLREMTLGSLLSLLKAAHQREAA